MKITYTTPTNIEVVVTGTSEELAPLILQFITTGDIIPQSDNAIAKALHPSSRNTKVNRKPHSSSPVYLEMRSKVLEDSFKGMSNAELSRKYGVSRNTISKWIRDNNNNLTQSSNNAVTNNLHSKIQRLVIK